MIHYSRFHSVMLYGVIFWGNSSYNNNNNNFRLQKRIIRITMGVSSRQSYRELFKIVTISPLQSYCVLSLVLFVVNNKSQFKVNSEMRSINTRNNSNRFRPLSALTFDQQGMYCVGIRLVFNSLPSRIKDLACDIRQYKSAVETFLHLHSLQTPDEHFNYNNILKSRFM